MSAHPLAYFDLSDASPDEVADLRAAVEADEEDDLQIRLGVGGAWHRREPARQKSTACGLPISAGSAMGWAAGMTLRQHAYTGELCRQCFTPFELSLSEAANKEETR